MSSFPYTNGLHKVERRCVKFNRGKKKKEKSYNATAKALGISARVAKKAQQSTLLKAERALVQSYHLKIVEFRYYAHVKDHVNCAIALRKAKSGFRLLSMMHINPN